MRRALVALVLLPSVAFGWSFVGHRRLASMMHEGFPAGHCLRQWLQARQSPSLQDSACDPDRWRDTTHPNYDPNEFPRHFVHMDIVSPPSAWPRDLEVATQQWGVSGVFANGMVPWRVAEFYPQLVAAFERQDEATILRLTFWLSHYVTDAHMPLHAHSNFDPRGMHSRWETDMFRDAVKASAIEADARTYIGTAGRAYPRDAIFDVATRGMLLVDQIIALDVAATDPDAGVACNSDFECPGQYCIEGACHAFDMDAFYGSIRELSARRWGDAVTVLASILWSAWADAGAPALVAFTGGCSMALPSGTPVLLGYPVTFTEPPAPDAGEGGGAGGGGEAPKPQPCGCSATPLGGVVALGLLALLRRRQRVRDVG